MKDKKNNPLNKYILDMCIIKSHFACKLGMTPQRLQIYLRDEASPSIDLAVLIERVTEGKVCVLDWIKAKDGR